MLNDKRLAAAVLSAAKSGTLKYRMREERLDLIGEDWALSVWPVYAQEKLRDTLGVIVKMLGFIPEGRCVEIYKTKEDYAMQELSAEAFGEELAYMTTCSGAERCQKTPVSIGTKRLLQTMSGRLAGLEAAPITIAGGADFLPEMNADGNRIRWTKNSIWEFTAKAFRPSGENKRLAAIWDTLECMELSVWEAARAQRDPDQMEIGENDHE